MEGGRVVKRGEQVDALLRWEVLEIAHLFPF